MPRNTAQTSPNQTLSGLVATSLRWKRRFFSSTDYQSAMEMFQDALTNGDCRAFWDLSLGLRLRKRYRHSFEDLQRELRVGDKRVLWPKPLMRNVFHLYKTERALAVQARKREAGELRSMTRNQRSRLAVPGIVTSRRRSTRKLARENRACATQDMLVDGGLVWIDNFNKFRYARNVNEERNRCINGAVMCVLPVQGLQGNLWVGWQPLSMLMRASASFSTTVQHAVTQIANEVKTLQQMPLTFDQVRVPCDVRRLGVRNLGWRPWAVYGENVGSTLGLLAILEKVLESQQVVRKTMPLLMDVNIYYRLLKLLYHKKLLRFNVRGAMSQHPLVFGIWHAYAHCVKRTFTMFKSVWAALEYPTFLSHPELTSVYLKPRLDGLEQMIVGIYLIHSECRTSLEDLVRQTNSDFGSTDWRHLLAKQLHLLVTVYVPCLFNLGMSVRECYWCLQQPNTGARARDVLSFCLAFLLALEKSEKNEYCRVIAMALLTWTNFHSSLPAAAFVEEVLEASLSRLGRLCATDLRRHSVGHFSEAYASLGPSRPVADLNEPHIAAALPFRIKIRVDKCVSLLRSGSFPQVVGAGVKAIGAWADSAVVHVPRSPLHDVTDEEVQRCLQHSILTMLDSGDVDDEVESSIGNLCRRAPSIDAQRLQASESAVDTAIRLLRHQLKRTPSRRRPQTVVTPAVDVDIGQDVAASQSDNSQATIAMEWPMDLGASSSLSFIPRSETATTDPEGRSTTTLSAACSDAGSFSSADTRSPACTSGDEFD